MLTVISCLVNDHDLRLVALAAIVCALASFSAITLLNHARKSSGTMRRRWVAVSAVSTGFGIWATHFIAMLAFAPGIPSAYNIALTFLSLIAAIVLTAGGLGVALRRRPVHVILGGAIVGGGIATMHYLGMAAFEVAGRIIWDPGLVASSIILGAVFGALALQVGLHKPQLRWKLGGAALLTVAICSHHFTAMGAVTIVPDPTVLVPDATLPTGWLAVLVAIASVGIVLLASAGLALDRRDQRRSELEAERMRELANAAVEGLIVCDEDVVVTANSSFCTLVGEPVAEIVGGSLDRYLPDAATRRKLVAAPHLPIESRLKARDGSAIPVELILRTLDYAGRPHTAIAVRDLRARMEAEQSIRFLAHHDSLTQLPNRSSFNERLDHELETAELKRGRVGVLCIDLDRFKEVNDLFGHSAGDKLLQAVANTMAETLSDKQMVARLSGDEFAVILPDLSDTSAASVIAERLVKALAALGDNELGTTASASIGIATYPEDGADRTTLMNNADTALYSAKREGRGTWRFFEAEMGALLRDRRQMEHDLRGAIQRNELSLVYQPQLDIRTEEVVGFEALLRWTHPVRGSVPPSTFVEIAEESSLIISIGDWVLRTACAEAAAWPRPLSVAVNVSAAQLYNPSFAKSVHEILLNTGLSPSRLEIEITETALIRDLSRAVATLRQLKTLGIRIAMDDFGTGYSSLSNLRAFAFDKIKVDQSFVKSVDVNDEAAAIVRAVLGLGRGLGLPVLAEGVETQGELSFLLGETCDEAQGFLLGRPASIGDFRRHTHGDMAADAAKIEVFADHRRRAV